MAIQLSVVIGRFQPVHIGHMNDVLIPAYEGSDHVLVLLGSANRAPSPKNPFSPEVRAGLIREAYESAGLSVSVDGALPRVQFRPLYDYTHSMSLWVADVQRLVTEYANALALAYDDDVQITLVGVLKDHSSFYLERFPQWELTLGAVNRPELYSATDVRASLYEGDERYLDLVPDHVAKALQTWRASEEFKWCASEYGFYAQYRAPYEAFAKERRHAYIGVTVDAVVFNRGRVLLVKRRFHPGKGLWALPGGYVREGEDTYSACVRELREETKFRMSRGWLFRQSLYDNPDRSLKGQTLSVGFGFLVPPNVDDDPVTHAQRVAGVRGGGDAAGAQWVPVNDVFTKPEFVRGMFEDHFDIVADMYRRIEE